MHLQTCSFRTCDKDDFDMFLSIRKEMQNNIEDFTLSIILWLLPAVCYTISIKYKTGGQIVLL